MPMTVASRILRSLPLHRGASSELRAAIKANSFAEFQTAFVAAIAGPLKRLRKSTRDLTLLALWSEDSVELTGRERELALSLDELTESAGTIRRKKGKRAADSSIYEEIIANWLVESAGIPGPWETIAIAEILLREARRLSPERFTEALAVLADAMLRGSSGGLFDGTSDSASDDDDVIRRIISEGESPWICSLLLSPLGGTQSLLDSACDALQKILMEDSDANGVIHGSLLQRLPEWLAPLTRCSVWSAAFRQPLWPGDCEARMTAVAERAALMLLPLARVASQDSPVTSGLELRSVLQVLLPLTSTAHDRRLQKLLGECMEPAGEVTRPKKLKQAKSDSAESIVAKAEKYDSKNPSKKRPARLATSWQSDSSCTAILRSSLDADADLLTMEWHSGSAQLMLAAAGVPILNGPWNWSVRLDDEIVPSPTTWKCSCWFLDPEIVFVELEGEDSGRTKRVRQLMLAPLDRFAMMTDSVTSSDPDRTIQLVTSVPLIEGTRCSTDPVTRELTLSQGTRCVRTFPLWLEDDRIQHSPGSYRELDGHLEMRGVGMGGTTLPLALDWHPKRVHAPADWTRLTITESRRVVGAHEAGSFRIRIGDHQVLLYRSLQRGKNSRAVLGLHTWDESVYCRVSAKGAALMPLVEVESRQ